MDKVDVCALVNQFAFLGRGQVLWNLASLLHRNHTVAHATLLFNGASGGNGAWWIGAEGSGEKVRIQDVYCLLVVKALEQKKDFKATIIIDCSYKPATGMFYALKKMLKGGSLPCTEFLSQIDFIVNTHRDELIYAKDVGVMTS